MASGSCPSSDWTFYELGDQGMPSGDGYRWCQLGGAGCMDASCIDAVHRDLVCGLSHEARTVNDCQGYDPLSGACPPGFSLEWGGDLGMPAGQGYTWCQAD